MKKLTLQIEDDNFESFMEILKELNYVTITESEEIPQWQKEEVQERLKKIKEGQMKSRSWEKARKEIFEF
ncbi:addiction module protein [Rhodohalobacter sp. 8-1]|uniref:addiction module protein n=1 Tax=Rhodohalobacter sp. 8-1 TaxID=3131972 RepID=UPI0030ECA5AA